MRLFDTRRGLRNLHRPAVQALNFDDRSDSELTRFSGLRCATREGVGRQTDKGDKQGWLAFAALAGDAKCFSSETPG